MGEIDATFRRNLLKEIRQERMMRSDMQVMGNDMRTITGHMASVMSIEIVQDTRIAEMMERFEPVEHRLERRGEV